MKRFSPRQVIWSLIGLAVAAAGVIMLWIYIFSFQDVTFRYDTPRGYVELIDSDNQKLYPKNDQPSRLKKGNYRLQHIGDDIAPSYRSITIGNNTKRIDIDFTYTENYLASLLTREKTAIRDAITTAYPDVTRDYTITHERLYSQGDVYGAALIARDAAGDNTDTLRIVVQRKQKTWHVTSVPPTPILSVFDYPDVDRAALVDINRAK